MTLFTSTFASLRSSTFLPSLARRYASLTPIVKQWRRVKHAQECVSHAHALYKETGIHWQKHHSTATLLVKKLNGAHL